MVSNLVWPLALENVRLKGNIGALFERFCEKRIRGEFARNVIFEETERAFREQLDDSEAPLGRWRGEFWGKMAISACRVCRTLHDEDLKAFLRESAQRILDCQRADGYIGTYRDDTLFMHVPAPAGSAGRYCDWNWNIWCRKYTLWGLIECWQLLEDEAILQGAMRFADQLMDLLQRTGTHICETGTFMGAPSASTLKPMLLLYQITGEKRYLDFALSIADALEDDKTFCAKIIRKGLTQEPVHLWNSDITDPDGRSMAISEKAYETMSVFDGVIELYRVTGSEKYLRSAQNFFALLLRYELNELDSVGFNDLFIHAASVQDAITEPCDVIHFMRIASELFALTGELSYLDVMEKAFLNPFLAGVFRDGTWGARGVRTAYHHLVAHNQSYMQHSHCCVNNLPRGFLNYAQYAVMTADDGVHIHFYTPLEAHTQDMRIVIGDGYQQYQRLSIRVETDRPQTLWLRIPPWSRENTIAVCGQTLHPAAGELCRVEISGTAEIAIAFEQRVELIERPYDREFYPLTPYMKRRFISDENSPVGEYLTRCPMASVLVGPTLLAVSAMLGGDIEHIRRGETVRGSLCTAMPAPHPDFRCAFDVTFEKEGQRFTRRMGDFASASDQDELYTLFV